VQAARAVVPHYHTTQVAALHRESGVLPAGLEVARRQSAWQLRAMAAREGGPCQAFDRLIPQKKRKGLPGPKQTNLARLWQTAPAPLHAILLPPERYVPAGRTWPDKKTQVKRVEELVRKAEPRTRFLYTNGSKIGENTT